VLAVACTMRNEALRSVTEALRIVTGRYGMLWKRYGVLRSVIEHYGSLQAHLWPCVPLLGEILHTHLHLLHWHSETD